MCTKVMGGWEKNMEKTVKKKRVRKRKGIAKRLKSLLIINAKINMKVQLIIGFFIPIAIMIYVGWYSYDAAADGMVDAYRDSTIKAIDMTAQLLNLGFQTVESDSLQIFNDANVNNYALGIYSNDSFESGKTEKAVDALLKTKTAANKFIEDIHLVLNEGTDNISTQGQAAAKAESVLSELLGENAAAINGKKKEENWSGRHSKLDGSFSLKEGDYICANYRMVSGNNACIVIDISAAKILSVLNELDMGDEAVLAFVTADGRELNVNSASDFRFADKEYYQQSAGGEAAVTSDYVMYNGREYLYMYSRCESNYAAICALVPKSGLMTDAIAMRDTIYKMIAVASIIVIIISTAIILGISSNMNRIISRLQKISQGDFTVTITMGGRTEFTRLAEHIMDMVNKIKSLIGNTKDIAVMLNEAVETVTHISGVIEDSTSQIQGSMQQMDMGMSRQATDASHCLEMVDTLSQNIISTEENVSHMNQIAADTHDMIRTGTGIMNQLTGQSSETGKITEEVGEKIDILIEKSQEISQFVDTINSIASQTTILSLNASIEAARAGEMGKGFAVVAGEIRKLADSSLAASAEIGKIVKVIGEMSMLTRKASSNAKQEVDKQSATVEETGELFHSMNDQIEKLLIDIKRVDTEMCAMSQERLETVTAIESISSVMEEMADSSTQVGNTVKEQNSQVVNLRQEALKMDAKMNDLLEAISYFQV